MVDVPVLARRLPPPFSIRREKEIQRKKLLNDDDGAQKWCKVAFSFSFFLIILKEFFVTPKTLYQFTIW
jgi:hypothetical protein